MKKSYSYEVLQEVSFDVDFKDLYETINQRIFTNSYFLDIKYFNKFYYLNNR